MPQFSELLIDEDLNRDMALVMRLVSLGHAARQKANRKVRQPLSEAAFSVANTNERGVVAAYDDLLMDELNVKKVRLLDASTEALQHTVKPLPKQLGQKYGNKFPGLQKAILVMNGEQVAHTLLADGKLQVELDGQAYEILPEEVEVKSLAKEGFAVAEDGAYVAALVTEMTPELAAEGLAREFVRRLQDFRKRLDLAALDSRHIAARVDIGENHAARRLRQVDPRGDDWLARMGDQRPRFGPIDSRETAQ